MNKKAFFWIFLTFFSLIFASPFNEKLSPQEQEKLSNGELLIRNINFKKNICLKNGLFPAADELLQIMDDLNPKYLAEIIQYKPYDGNEDLPDKLLELLNNIPSYTQIPYYSKRGDKYYDLYESAEITETFVQNNVKTIKAVFKMQPFDTVYQTIFIKADEENLLYAAQNDNKLRYLDKFDCVFPKQMKTCILVFKDGEKWVIYGIGGVNAPRIPVFTERIQISFINRISTFCNFIFKEL